MTDRWKTTTGDAYRDPLVNAGAPPKRVRVASVRPSCGAPIRMGDERPLCPLGWLTAGGKATDVDRRPGSAHNCRALLRSLSFMQRFALARSSVMGRRTGSHTPQGTTRDKITLGRLSAPFGTIRISSSTNRTSSRANITFPGGHVMQRAHAACNIQHTTCKAQPAP